MTEKTKTKLIELSFKNCQIYKTFPIFFSKKNTRYKVISRLLAQISSRKNDVS